MNVNSTSAANALDSLNPGSTAAKKTSEKDMFMTLLVAQLKNQDPLQPQDGTAFVAQLAQLNSLDQLSGIRESVGQLNTYLQSLTQPASTGA